MRHGRWMVAVLFLVACQPSGGGGGGTAYTPNDQPAVNPYATPDPMMGGGRTPRETGGPNAGSHGTPPSAGSRGSGSRYYPYTTTPRVTPNP